MKARWTKTNQLKLRSVRKRNMVLGLVATTTIIFYQKYCIMLCMLSAAGVSLRFGAGGHSALAPRQSSCKALKILKIYSCRDAKSSLAKPSSQPVNISGAWPLMKPLLTVSINIKTNKFTIQLRSCNLFAKGLSDHPLLSDK